MKKVFDSPFSDRFGMINLTFVVFVFWRPSFSPLTPSLNCLDILTDTMKGHYQTSQSQSFFSRRFFNYFFFSSFVICFQNSNCKQQKFQRVPIARMPRRAWDFYGPGPGSRIARVLAGRHSRISFSLGL